MSWDVIIYDEHQSWSPSLLASGRNGQGVGGWECMMVQLAEGLARAGLSVLTMNPDGWHSVIEDGRWARLDIGLHQTAQALLTGRHSGFPAWASVAQSFTACVDDPTHALRDYDHLRGRSTLIHLSEWQRSLYVGHERGIVIPSMINDWIYGLPRVPKSGYVCVSAWNKGTDATLKLWGELGIDGTLSVGTPYGAPPDAYERCAAVGARWLGQLTPREIVHALNKAEAVFRVCERPETFGVTDAIAEVVGTRVNVLCTNGVGAAREVLSGAAIVTEDADSFARCIRAWHGKWGSSLTNFTDRRVSTLIPRWIEAMGLS